jgi:Flp pilus assembly pilin Flp
MKQEGGSRFQAGQPNPSLRPRQIYRKLTTFLKGLAPPRWQHCRDKNEPARAARWEAMQMDLAARLLWRYVNDDTADAVMEYSLIAGAISLAIASVLVQLGTTVQAIL